MKPVHEQKKSLGQVFLIDPNIQRKIIQLANPDPKTHVLEIGCGNGILSAPLSKILDSMSIIELDRYYASHILEYCDSNCEIQIINEDFCKTKFSKIKAPRFDIIANIPYQISTEILESIIENRDRIQKATLMVQKEYANRLAAKPGTKQYGSLSIFAQFYCDIKQAFPVSRNCFQPIPNVDSSVIQVIPKNTPLFDVTNAFFQIVKASFWGRRKTLVNCLKNSPFYTLKVKPEDTSFFQKNPKIRGETLSIESFYELYCELEQK